MKEYIGIEEALSRLRSEFDWYHSFIRECYFSTLHCFQGSPDGSGDDTLGDAWSPLNLRIVVAATGNPVVFGIEFLCVGVKVFSLQRLDELAFDCQCEKEWVTLSLGNASINTEDCWVMCREIHVAFLGREYLGPWLRLGFEFPHAEAIEATSIDECWRQCTSCYNAWSENPEVQYSRCPDCGELTKLQD